MSPSASDLRRVRPSSPIARLLVDAVQQAPLAQDYRWDDIDARELQMAALVHGVAPATYLHLRSSDDVPDELRSRLQTSHRDQLFRHMRVLSDMRPVVSALDDAGVAWVAVKGPVLAETVWPRADMRAYTDVDLVVDRRRFSDVLAALETVGASLVDRNWPFIRDQGRAELSLTLAYGTALDLHWDLVNDIDLRRVFRFPQEEMYERARRIQLEGMAVPTLDPVDTVLHLAYHSVLSGGHRLVWLRDFQLATAAPGMDWDELARRAERYGVRLALDLMIQRTQRVLGPVAPSGFRGRRSLWSGVASVADRLRPVPALPGDNRLSGRIVFQSTRGGSASSLLAGVRDLRKDRSNPVVRQENPLHLDVDDPAARAEYLAAVEGPEPSRARGH